MTLQLYTEFRGAVKDILIEPALTEGGEPLFSKMGTPCVPSLKSFKVMLECPLIGTCTCRTTVQYTYNILICH